MNENSCLTRTEAAPSTEKGAGGQSIVLNLPDEF